VELLITDYFRCLCLSERILLRASTKEQNAKCAKNKLIQFATDHGLKAAVFYIENGSGATLVLTKLI